MEIWDVQIIYIIRPNDYFPRRVPELPWERQDNWYVVCHAIPRFLINPGQLWHQPWFFRSSWGCRLTFVRTTRLCTAWHAETAALFPQHGNATVKKALHTPVDATIQQPSGNLKNLVVPLLVASQGLESLSVDLAPTAHRCSLGWRSVVPHESVGLDVQ